MLRSFIRSTLVAVVLFATLINTVHAGSHDVQVFVLGYDNVNHTYAARLGSGCVITSDRKEDSELRNGEAIIIDQDTFSINKEGTDVLFTYRDVPCDSIMVHAKLTVRTFDLENAIYTAMLNGKAVKLYQLQRGLLAGQLNVEKDVLVSMNGSMLLSNDTMFKVEPGTIYTIALPVVMN